jgi:hypothetical protein
MKRIKYVMVLAGLGIALAGCAFTSPNGTHVIYNPNNTATVLCVDTNGCIGPNGVHYWWHSQVPVTDWQVTYYVTGTGTADITYQTPTGVSQQSDVALPFQLTIDPGTDGFVYISAQRSQLPDPGGPIACSIFYNGQQLALTQSNGMYVIASCDADVNPLPPL